MPWSPLRTPCTAARLISTGVFVAALTACGGGGTDSSDSTSSSSSSGLLSFFTSAPSDAEAQRFLVQATFGPTAQDVARVKAVGYETWIDEQFQRPLQTRHLAMVEASSAALNTSQPGVNDLMSSWWTHAITDPAQLRQRVAFALSEIFVVSTVDAEISEDGRMTASYLDMLTDHADGNYRDLLQAVALHPAMGAYLSHRANRKENTATGRIPDENFAREVMQLFSIGLVELNDDGTLKLTNGQPKETYTADDVKGLAKVFTGWSWYRPPSKASVVWWRCFWHDTLCRDSSQNVTAMSAYTEEHSTSEKRFLGVVVPAQSTPNPQASLKAALDRLASHPNTAPFICKQLIQRLVTSNPSPGYMSRVTAAFRASDGNLKATVKAILLDAEARDLTSSRAVGYGKLREPLLRITHVLRAIPHQSDTYNARSTSSTTPFYLASSTHDAVSELGQTPLRSPSVFNFFRPGYKPPQTGLSTQGLVAPEMQITNETTVLGYANFVAQILEYGWGRYNTTSQRVDVRFDLSSFDALVAQPNAAAPQQLITALSQRLLGGPAPSDLNDLMVATVGSMPNVTSQDRRRRVVAVILMLAVSPSFLTQQ